MEVGFVSVWFARGQSYVTRSLMGALDSKHGTHLLARQGVVGHIPGSPRYLETAGIWAHPDRVETSGNRIDPVALAQWVRSRQLDWVVFNEEGQWELVEAARRAGARTATYVTIDWVLRADLPKFAQFDLVVAPAGECVRQLAPYVAGDRLLSLGWGVDLECFSPTYRAQGDLVFLHNAGWGGSGYRKNTPAVVAAWRLARLRDARLVIHTQRPWRTYPLATRWRSKGIEIVEGTLDHPGLYPRADVLVQPSKMEGLGLPLLEGLASGLPVVTTDAPVMNEWIADSVCGRLVPVGRTVQRSGGYVVDRLAMVDHGALARILVDLASNPAAVKEMGRAARQRAVEHHDWRAIGARFLGALERVDYSTAHGATRP